ncbi:MAG: SDR family oxidoreductase [Candidatus Paceibacterota bacterium]
MRILVTGGNGYIGARLCLNLADEGFDVIPICRSRRPEDKVWASKMHQILVGDLNTEYIYGDISHINPDIIIHLVSLDHFDSEKEPGYVTDINVKPTWKLLDISKKIGVNKFIYFSTTQVYGKPDPIKLNESTLPNPKNAYGLTHLMSESICEYYNRNSEFEVINVRLSNSYGSPIFKENNCWWLAINDLCKGAYYNNKIELLSDGSPLRDFIHGEDVSNAVLKLIEKTDKLDNEIYHISSATTYSLLEVAFIIQSVYKDKYNKLLPIHTPSGIAPEKNINNNNSNRFTFENSKIKNLGFELNYSLKQGIQELFNYFERTSDY